MDESSVRDLLERLADDEPPPSRVSVTQARRSGRRRLRLRRVYLPGAAAPIAAAIAVALIAGLSAGVHGGRLPHPAVAPPAAPVSAPTRFDPLVPYAAFGWLPSGFSAAGPANQTTQMTTQMSLTASARRSGAAIRTRSGSGHQYQLMVDAQYQLTVYAAGQCRLGGPISFKVPPAKLKTKLGDVRTRYPYSLSCQGVGIQPLTGRAPGVDGQPAYWSVGAGAVSLAWEYGHRAWAVLIYQPAIYLSPSAQPHPRPTPAPSPASLAILRKVASRVRFGVNSTVVYGFTLSGLPGSWQLGRTGSSYNVASLDGRDANVGWMAGPAVDPTALGISVWPAGIQGSFACKFVAGQSRYVKIDGARAILRTIDLPGKHVQYLCAQDVQGMQIYLSLDLSNPNVTAYRPLPGSHTVGDLLKVFSHMRLLGPDVAHWTASPVPHPASATSRLR